MITREDTRDILDTDFYIYEGMKGIYFGAAFPFGVIASQPISKDDYIDWLRDELEKCHPIVLPQSFMEAFR